MIILLSLIMTQNGIHKRERDLPLSPSSPVHTKLWGEIIMQNYQLVYYVVKNWVNYKDTGISKNISIPQKNTPLEQRIIYLKNINQLGTLWGTLWILFKKIFKDKKYFSHFVSLNFVVSLCILMICKIKIFMKIQ
jgi:hypothetical protein